jgi:hypothetical protein
MPDGGNAINRLASAGLLSNPPARDFEPPGQGVVKDALAYLHANCGHCHNADTSDVNARTPKLRLHVADVDPTATDTYATTINVSASHAVGERITSSCLASRAPANCIIE